MAKISFSCSSEQIKFLLSNKRSLKDWIAKTIANERLFLSELSFIFCDDEYLYSINKKFLKHNTYTDIITFDYLRNIVDSKQLTIDKKSKINKSAISGEIFISIERVKENAKKFKTVFENELHRIMIHGVLHLCGYNDKSSSGKKTMSKKEDYYLSLRKFI